jgi:hypothetical protein
MQAGVLTVKESARWARGIRAASSRVADPSKLIHVADREGDIYPLLAELRDSGARFIIRSAQNRAVDVGDLRSHLRDVSRETPTRYTIDVPLSRRSKVKWLRYPHAPRDARTATLSVATASVGLRRPQWNPKSQPESVPVHLVHVFELGPPPLAGFDPSAVGRISPVRRWPDFTCPPRHVRTGSHP